MLLHCAQRQHESTRWSHPAFDLESHLALLIAAQRITQHAPWRMQAMNRDALSIHPARIDTCREHQGAIVLALISEHVEHGANEIARDPTMRHVADEARLARV